MKTLMRKLSTTVLVTALTVSIAVADGSPRPPRYVDIYQVSFDEYVDGATSNMDGKERAERYVDELYREADVLAAMMVHTLGACHDLVPMVQQAHTAMKDYALAMAQVRENLLWYDYETGEFRSGTGYGHESLRAQAEILWMHVVAYNLFGTDFDPQMFNTTSPIGVAVIGGVQPYLMPRRALQRIRAEQVSASLEPTFGDIRSR